jgi:hypothetical protein
MEDQADRASRHRFEDWLAGEPAKFAAAVCREQRKEHAAYFTYASHARERMKLATVSILVMARG